MNKGQTLYNRALKSARQKKPNIVNVLRNLTLSLELGNHHAAWALGAWYLRGEYVKQNIKKAVRLLQYASEANIPDAMFDLAVCFEKGQGKTKDERLAFELYLRAALRGFKYAFVEVGRCYYWGMGTAQDKHVGELWFDRSKEIGAFRSDEDDDPPRKVANLRLIVHKRKK